MTRQALGLVGEGEVAVNVVYHNQFATPERYMVLIVASVRRRSQLLQNLHIHLKPRDGHKRKSSDTDTASIEYR